MSQINSHLPPLSSLSADHASGPDQQAPSLQGLSLAMACSFLWPKLVPGIPYHKSCQVLATPLSLKYRGSPGAQHVLFTAQPSLSRSSALDTSPLTPTTALIFWPLRSTLASHLGLSKLSTSTTVKGNWDLTLRQTPGWFFNVGKCSHPASTSSSEICSDLHNPLVLKNQEQGTSCLFMVYALFQVTISSCQDVYITPIL